MFGSATELRQHKRSCSRANSHSFSTDTTNSPCLSDVEILSDSDSVSVTSDHSPEQFFSTSNSVKGESVRTRRRGQRRKRNTLSGSSSGTGTVTSPLKPQRSSSDMKVSKSGSDIWLPVEEEEEEEEDGEGASFGIWSDSSESLDEEDDMTFGSPNMTRLLSLNEQENFTLLYNSDSEEEEEGEGEGEEREWDEDLGNEDVVGAEMRRGTGKVRKNQRKQRKKEKEAKTAKSQAFQHPSSSQEQQQQHSHFGQLEPVGLFWDIENCNVPAHKSAFALATKMRRVFFEGKREAEFMVVCDITKEKKEVTDALHKAQVSSGCTNHCRISSLTLLPPLKCK